MFILLFFASYTVLNYLLSAKCIPSGFQIIENDLISTKLKYQTKGMRSACIFLTLFFLGWTIPSFVIAYQVFLGPAGFPSRLFFVGLFFWPINVYVAWFVVTYFFTSIFFYFDKNYLVVDFKLFIKFSQTKISRNDIIKVIQIKDGGVRDLAYDGDSFPSWGLVLVCKKTKLRLLYRQPRQKSEWLGQLIAIWAESEFLPSCDAYPRKKA